jgi:ABC transport system ATP-binding/permease protein
VGGGYTDYLEARMAREARLAVEEGKRRKLIEKELAWARRSPPARTGKQKARRARAREMADQQRLRDLGRGRDLDMRMTEAPRLGRTVLELENVSHAYGDHAVLTGVSDRLLAGEKIGIIGPNGAGKSTLLKIIAGLEAPASGRVALGENTRIAYFDQHRKLDPELTVGQALGDREWIEMGGQRVHIRAYLDRFLFPPHVLDQRVSVLSGGERNRLLLARLFLVSFNLLLLDEPTNDLDLDTLQVLEDLLESFGGCLLVVSHDRYFLDKLCSSLLVFREGGQVLRHHGNWDAWLAREEARIQAEAEAAQAQAQAQAKSRGGASGGDRSTSARGDSRLGPRRRTDREERELRTLRERIEALEGESAELEVRLADASIYAEGDGGAAQRATQRYAEVTEALEQALERWMELEELEGR